MRARLTPTMKRQAGQPRRPWACSTSAPRARQRSVTTHAAAVEAAEVTDGALESSEVAVVGSVRKQLAGLFLEAMQSVFPAEVIEGVTPAVAPCANPKFGDYQFNNAMGIFKALKGHEAGEELGNPRAVAEAIIAALPETDMVDATSVAGPGFINVTLSRDWLAQRLGALLTEEGGVRAASGWRPAAPEGVSKAVVDFSSPNIAKEMHVGHLRSTIIGDTLCRALELAGIEVLRLNHVGDWGTQFGMLIEHLKDGEEEGGDGETSGAESGIGDLQAFYKQAKVRFDEDAEFKERAQAAVVNLQSSDGDERARWRRICDVSRQEFDAIYRRLGITLEERGESFYNAYIPKVLAELEEKGVAREDDGALCVFSEGRETPLIVRKSDGGFNYGSTDLSAVWQRVFEEKADWMIYVTDMGQGSHFESVFDGARRAGWLEREGEGAGDRRLSHVGFGVVLGEDGKRFRTRSGEVVRLVDLLDEAKSRAFDALRERGKVEELGEAEAEAAAEAMGYGAVKYADLRNNRATNYTFSFDRMLDLKGDTAVYLLYAHARIASILRKSGQDVRALAATEGIALEHPSEVALARELVRFPEAVEDLLSDLAPNRVCEYLYGLSSTYNEFYAACPVLGSDQQTSRLLLCEATATVMRACFEVIGITPLYRL